VAGKGSRGRRWGAIALVVLSSILFFVSILAVGTARLVLDTDRFSSAVDRSLQEPEVSNALADYLAGQLTTALAESGAVDRLVPDELDRLVPVIDAALGSVIESRSRDFVGSERGRDLVVNAVARAHGAVLRVLENEPPAGGLVQVDDDQVSLNLVPVAVAVLGRVQSTGLLSDLDVPEIDSDETPAEQIDTLNGALGTNLPDDFAQLAVYDRPNSGDQSVLAQARRALSLFKSAVWLIVIVTVLLAALAVVLAPDRRRILLWLAGGFGLAAVLCHAVVKRVTAGVPDLLVDPEARAATREVIHQSLSTLDQTVQRLAIIFGILALVLLVLGASRTPQAIASLRGLAERSPDVVRFGGLGIAALIVLLFGFDLVPVLLAVAVGVAGFVLTRSSTAGSTPSPSLSGEGASGRHTP
jgi:hypothetical protein